MLKVDDKWIWDFWLVQDEEDYHIFYLQADKSLGDPELRHLNVTIGHAVSSDLVIWQIKQEALCPETDNIAADSLTTWTGSIIKKDALWYMFYTGTSKVEDGLVQRVCLATSKDLYHWDKVDQNPVMEVDERYYDKLCLTDWKDESWRDPWVHLDKETGLYHLYLTCRTKQGPADGRGAIGHAISKDLKGWKVQPPLFAPGCFGEMEVPQVEKIGEKYYLFFTVTERYMSQKARDKCSNFPASAFAYATSDSHDGPYNEDTLSILQGDDANSLYAGRVVRGPDHKLYMMAFNNLDQEGRFMGTVSDPMEIKVTEAGLLTLDNLEVK